MLEILVMMLLAILHKYNLNLSYDGKRLKWNNNREELRRFFQNVIGQNGKWTIPGGYSKRYVDNNFDLCNSKLVSG